MTAAVSSLRGKNRISKCPKRRASDPRHGPFNAEEAARELGVTMSTVHRWLRDGILAGEQLTPGAPWRIVLRDEVRERLNGGEAPQAWVGLTEAARRLGVSKSQVAYWVKSGKLAAVRVTVGGTDQMRILLLYTCNRDRCPEPRGSRRRPEPEERLGT